MLGTRAAVGSFHWPRFIAENEKMLLHMVQETHDRNAYLSKNTTLDMESYIIKRRLTLGIRPLFILIQSTRCLYIPDDVFANPVIEEMENATTDMIFIANVSETAPNLTHPPRIQSMLHPGYLFLQEGISL